MSKIKIDSKTMTDMIIDLTQRGLDKRRAYKLAMSDEATKSQVVSLLAVSYTHLTLPTKA